MKSTMQLFALLAMLGTGVVLTTGCESTSTVEQTITVTPASSSLYFLVPNGTNEAVELDRLSVTLTAQGNSTNTFLVLPLEWTVANGSLGRILSSAGVSAVYEAYPKDGVNSVTVRDQIGQSGVASITQTTEASTPGGVQ